MAAVRPPTPTTVAQQLLESMVPLAVMKPTCAPVPKPQVAAPRMRGAAAAVLTAIQLPWHQPSSGQPEPAKAEVLTSRHSGRHHEVAFHLAAAARPQRDHMSECHDPPTELSVAASVLETPGRPVAYLPHTFASDMAAGAGAAG